MLLSFYGKNVQRDMERETDKQEIQYIHINNYQKKTVQVDPPDAASQLDPLTQLLQAGGAGGMMPS